MAKKPMTHVMIDLGEKHLKIAKQLNMKVGSRVRLVLVGELTGLTQHAQLDKSEHPVTATGSLEIDVRSLRLLQSSEIADLFDDEDEAVEE